MKIVKLYPYVTDFGEDKDIAAALREREIKPAIAKNEKVRIDFDKVTLATQSFVHALISDVLRTKGEDVLKLLEFKNCVEVVRGIISTVVQYSLDTMDDDDEFTQRAERDEKEKKQSHKFMKVAQASAADDNEAAFEERLKRVVKATRKDTKTAQ